MDKPAKQKINIFTDWEEKCTQSKLEASKNYYLNLPM